MSRHSPRDVLDSLREYARTVFWLVREPWPEHRGRIVLSLVLDLVAVGSQVGFAALMYLFANRLESGFDGVTNRISLNSASARNSARTSSSCR